MSESARRVQTNTEWQVSDGFVILPADGTILRANREQANITFFVEHTIPEIRKNKTFGGKGSYLD